MERVLQRCLVDCFRVTNLFSVGVLIVLLIACFGLLDLFCGYCVVG